MFEHTKALKELNAMDCKKLTGKKCRGKFFADRTSTQGMFRELSSTGDIGVLANCPRLIEADFYDCGKLTGKGSFSEPSLETSLRKVSPNFLL